MKIFFSFFLILWKSPWKTFGSISYKCATEQLIRLPFPIKVLHFSIINPMSIFNPKSVYCDAAYINLHTDSKNDEYHVAVILLWLTSFLCVVYFGLPSVSVVFIAILNAVGNIFRINYIVTHYSLIINRLRLDVRYKRNYIVNNNDIKPKNLFCSHNTFPITSQFFTSTLLILIGKR